MKLDPGTARVALLAVLGVCILQAVLTLGASESSVLNLDLGVRLWSERN